MGEGHGNRGNNNRKPRAERAELPKRLTNQDLIGAQDKYVPVMSSELEAGWWVVQATSTVGGALIEPSGAWTGIPVDMRVKWTGTGGLQNALIATVPSSERVFIHASSVIVEARSRSHHFDATFAVTLTPVDQPNPSRLYYDAEISELQAPIFVMVPRWAKRFRVELSDPTEYGTVSVLLYGGSVNGLNVPTPYVKHYLSDMPDNGWAIGGCRLMQIVGPLSLFRVVFELEL